MVNGNRIRETFKTREEAERRAEQIPIVETTEDGITNLPNRLAKAAGLPKWKHNALRHSYGSYYLGLPGDPVKTAFQMGNSPVVYNRYKGLVSHGDVKTYWSLRPAESAEKIVPMQAATNA